MNDWYYQTPAGTFGPLSADEMKDKVALGEIGPNTLVRSGGEEWCCAERFVFLGLASNSSVPKRLADDSVFHRLEIIIPATAFLVVTISMFVYIANIDTTKGSESRTTNGKAK